MARLTRTQQRVLAFIQETIFETGESPTYEEIAIAMGYAAKSNAYRIVQGLVRRGAVAVLPAQNRSIQLLGPYRHPRLVSVPADPVRVEFEAAKAVARAAEKTGEDAFLVFWHAMIAPYEMDP